MNRYLITAIFLMAGCSSLYQNPAFDLVEGYFIGFKDEVTKDFFDNAKYSFARVKFGRGPASILTLNTIDEGSYEWISADGVKIYTFNGHIYKTIGLPSDVLYEKIYLNNLDTDTPSRIGQSITSFIEPDLSAAQTFYSENLLKKNCQYERFSEAVSCTLIRQTVEISSIKFTANNIYFLDQDGKSLASHQKIHPHLPRIYIEYFFR
tara:strand:- start:382 stop:1002 length:621 start_codon:yes stop_codon:yes gene_type:complete